MSFQWIFDNAAQISVDNKNIVGQTITRNQTVRAVSRGNGIYKFTVTMPAGMKWSDVADDIANVDAMNRYTPGNISINNSGYNSWMHNGDIDNTTYNVICVELPTWTIVDQNIVSWSGPFVFYENQV